MGRYFWDGHETESYQKSRHQKSGCQDETMVGGGRLGCRGSVSWSRSVGLHQTSWDQMYQTDETTTVHFLDLSQSDGGIQEGM